MSKSNTTYLTVEVNWRGRCGPDAVKRRLQDSAVHLLEEGLLTPDQNCELVAWQSRVHEDALPTPAAAQLLPELIRALEMMQKALTETMPGVKHIACQNYAILNEAPIAAKQAVSRAKKLLEK